MKFKLDDFTRNPKHNDFNGMDQEAREYLYTLCVLFACDPKEGVYNIYTDEHETINDYFKRRSEEAGAKNWLDYLERLFQYATITKFIEEKAKVPLLEQIREKMVGELKE